MINKLDSSYYQETSKRKSLQKFTKDQLSEIIAISDYPESECKLPNRRFSNYRKKKLMRLCKKSDLIDIIIEDEIPICLLYGFDSEVEYRDSLIGEILE